MGYSIEVAFIRPCINETDFLSFVNAFSTVNLSFKSQLQFVEARRDDRNAVYIGNYRNTTIFFFEGMFHGKKTERGFSPAEQKIIDLNKDKTVLCIQNEESACGYYYHLSVNGQTVRRKEGDDGGLIVDIGDELPLEKECYQDKSIDDDGETIYKVWWERGQRFNDSRHYEIGGTMAFNLCKEFIGNRFEEFPDDLIVRQYVEGNQ